jgi:hypothetical protein
VPPASEDDPGDDAGEEAAGDPEPALPHLDRVGPVAPEPVVVGGHVVGAGSDQAGDDGPGGEAADVGRITASCSPAALRDDHGHEDADRDGEPVGAQLERAD